MQAKQGYRVRYVGDSHTPAPGTIGTAYRCGGYYNPSDLEYGAYCFVPDNLNDPEVAGYYVGDDDLEDL